MKAASTTRNRWRPPWWPSAPLRTYLVAVILLATVPIAGLMSWQIFTGVKDQQQRLESDLRQGADALAQAVRRELESSIDTLSILAQVDSLQRGDIARFERELGSRRLLRPEWRAAFLAEHGGSVLFSTRGEGDRALGAAPVLTALLGAGEPRVSGRIADSDGTGHATAVVVPVRISGVARYMLGAWIDSAAWQRLIEQPAPAPEGLRSLFDSERRLIARASPAEHSVGPTLPAALVDQLGAQPSGFVRIESVDGDPVYAAWQTVPLGGWGVGVGVSATPVDAMHRRSIIAAVGTAAACLLLGVTLALLFARSLTEPLHQLARHGAATPLAPIPVQEIELLRDALLAAQAQDEVVRDRLQNKADEFEALFQSSPIGLAFAMDAQGRQVLYNPAMARLLGAPPIDDDAATPVQVLHDGRVLTRAEEPLYRAAGQGERITGMELELRAEAGPPRFAIASAVPLRDEHGRPRGAIGAVVDISERKQVEARLLNTDQRLRESQHLMDLAQEAGHVGFFHYRFDADKLSWTPGLSKLFGIEDPPLAESAWSEWARRIDAADRERVEATLRHLLAERRERETIEFRVAGDDGRWLSARMLVSYGIDGQPQQMIGVSVDMSEQKRAEQERAALVEREQAARRSAEAANRAKDEFLAMLGHELRNPLSAISSAVEVLGRVDAGSDLAGSARNIIARQTRHLAHMMEDLLDVARVISGKVGLSRHPLNLAALVQRAAATLEVTGAAREHRLELQLDEVWIDADSTRIDQVMNNLLTNALKYTPADGRIAVRVLRDGDAARLDVSDTGIGIPSALLPRIFDLFVQGERSLDRRAGGLGIGLTLVRRLIELHGGTIEASSSAEGSVFSVWLPAMPAPAATGATTDGSRAHVSESRRRSVTLIEDNEDARDALRSLLELDGHSVSVANDGPSGLASLLAARPDVAVIDIGLPGITGFEVARRSRAAGYAGRMIALSGYGQERDVQQALASGFDAHLVKPVDADKLRALMVED